MESTDELALRVRRTTVEMLRHSSSGHPGSSLSCVEILVSLFANVLRGPADSPEDIDRFLLSKGHAAPALYAVLIETGRLERSAIPTLRRGGSALQGHPDERFLRLLDFSSGSLGQCLSVGAGYALGQRMRGGDGKTFVVLGDGELQEGQVWEAAMFAAHHRLGKLRAIVDRNGLQLDGPTESIVSLGDLEQKFLSFGWDVYRVDGHDIAGLTRALVRPDEGKPLCVIADTVKGKGVSFMEGKVEWHSIHDPASAKRDLDAAMAELTP